MEGLFSVVIIFGVAVFFESCSSLEASSAVASKISLTTAKVRDDDLIPKPTSYVKRTDVVPVEQNTSNELGAMGPQRRAANYKSPLQNVWEWDYWCLLQPKSGTCSGAGRLGQGKTRYYYKAQMNSCKPFLFSGCGGNENNFETLEKCNRSCKGSTRMSLKNTDHSLYCGLQPDVGLCFALLQRYYYDIQTNECKTFIYGGCGGNQNRFDNYERCEERCMNKK